MRVSNAFNYIDDVLIIEPDVHHDDRGYFFETFNQAQFDCLGKSILFVQDNQVYSKKNVLRGLHINFKRKQVKLIRVIHGSIYDVVVDLRKDSKSYLMWGGIELSAKNNKQLFVPDGFAHGYLALEDTMVQYKTNLEYIPDEEMGILYNSKDLNIQWPVRLDQIIVGEKDRLNMDFSLLELNRGNK